MPTFINLSAGPERIVSRLAEPQHAEHARAIGIVAANYAIMEAELEGLFGALLRLDYHRSKIAFYGIVTNRTRTDIISALLGEFYAGTPIAAEWTKLSRKVKNATDQRNEIVRSIWAEGRKPHRVNRQQTLARSKYSKFRRDYSVGDIMIAADNLSRRAAEISRLHLAVRNAPLPLLGKSSEPSHHRPA